MNYISVDVLRYAAMVMESIEKAKELYPDQPAGLACQYQEEHGGRPCGRTAKYLVADGTRVLAGGDIEEGPLWFCREHLEEELGELVREQPLFRRTEGFAGDE